jgi:hypothetical protein
MTFEGKFLRTVSINAILLFFFVDKFPLVFRADVEFSASRRCLLLDDRRTCSPGLLSGFRAV